MQKNHFLLFKKLKNTESAQLWKKDLWGETEWDRTEDERGERREGGGGAAGNSFRDKFEMLHYEKCSESGGLQEPLARVWPWKFAKNSVRVVHRKPDL